MPPAPLLRAAAAAAVAAAMLAVFSTAAAPSPLSAPGNGTQWSSVKIGGGGYVLQSFFHNITPHAYIKTDVGGIYLRAGAPGAYSWTPLLDWAGPSDSTYYGVSGFAMDPADGARIFIMTGPYWAYSNCSLLSSADAGSTWTVLPASQGWGLLCGANEGDRAVGDRLSVHPALPGTVAVGGSDGRVYVTIDAFASAPPARIVLPPPAAPAACVPGKNSSCVVRTVAWLEGAAAGPLLLAAVPALGLFASAGPDYTTGWSFVAGSDAPSDINRLLVLPAGRIWATAGRGGVWRGDVTSDGTGGWHITWGVAGALAAAGVPFAGVAVRGAGGSDVVVMSMLTDNNTTLWRSADAGASFAPVPWSCVSQVPWWGQDDYNTRLNAASSLSFDPHTEPAPQLWATDFFGAYVADASPAAPAPGSIGSGIAPLNFTNVELGHEEVCMNVIRAPAAGAVLSGAADVGGWRHDNGLDAWPSATFKAADGWAHNCVFDIDASLAVGSDGAPSTVWVTAGDEYGACHGSPSWCGLHSWVGVSRDGGRTFTDTTWDDVYAVDQANPYRVVAHPYDGTKAVVVARKGLPVTHTRDGGATWANSTGPGVTSCGEQGNFWFAYPLAVENQIDPAAPEATIYYYNGTTTLFTSADSGATFAATYAGFPTWDVPFFGIATPPRGAAAAGDVWVFAGWKLYHSVNAGANFSQVWELYSLDHVMDVGPLPNVTSPRSGRGAGELAALCEARGRARAAAAGLPGLPQQPRTATGAAAAYAVYAIGEREYGIPAGLFGSVDFGHSWVPLAGVNSSTPAQGLGDSPYVLEASAAQPGVLFVGTGGRGAFWRDVSADLAAALLRCEEEE